MKTKAKDDIKTATWERISIEEVKRNDEVLFIDGSEKIHGRAAISTESYLVLYLITPTETRFRTKRPGDEMTFYKPHIKKIGRRVK